MLCKDNSIGSTDQTVLIIPAKTIVVQPPRSGGFPTVSSSRAKHEGHRKKPTTAEATFMCFDNDIFNIQKKHMVVSHAV